MFSHAWYTQARLETNRRQYANFQLLKNVFKMAFSISLEDAQKLWRVMMKEIKKRTESARLSHISQYDYWLLRQG